MIVNIFKEKMCLIKKQEILQLFFLNLIILLYCSICFGLNYETDDDRAMIAIVSGAYIQSYADMAFSNFVLGKLLKILYMSIDSINWYAIFMYIVSFCMFFILTYLINQSKKDKWCKWIFSLIFLLASTPYVYSIFNFTRVANLTAIAGFALGFWSIKYMKKWMSILSFLIILLAGMIRIESLLMIALFPFLYCLSNLISARNDKKKILCLLYKYGLIFAIPIITAIFLNYISRNHCKDFYEYNLQRSYVCDYAVPEYEDEKEEYEKIYFSENDVEMIKTWSFEDPDVFTKDNFAFINKLIERDYFSLQTVIDALKNIWHSSYETAMMVIALISIILGVVSHHIKEKEKLVLAGISYCVIYIYLSGLGRIVQRVTMGGALGVLFLAFYHISIDYTTVPNREISFGILDFPMMQYENLDSVKLKKGINKNRKKCLIAILLTFLVINGSEIDTWIGKNISMHNKPQTSIMDEMSRNKNNLYFIDTETFALLADKNVKMFSTIPKHYYSNIYSLGGWSTQHPAKREVLYSNNMGNPFKDAVNRENTYFVDIGNMEVKANFIREHYYKDFNYYAVKQIDGINFYAGYTGEKNFDIQGSKKSENIVINKLSVSESNESYIVTLTVKCAEYDFFDKNFFSSVEEGQDKEKFYFGCIKGTRNELMNDTNEVEFSFSKNDMNEDSQLNIYLDVGNDTYIIETTTIRLLKERFN